MSKLGDVLSKLVQLNRFKDGGLGVEPKLSGAMEVWGRSLQALENFEKSYFNSIGSHFAIGGHVNAKR